MADFARIDSARGDTPGPFRPDDLMSAAAFDHPVADLEVLETNTSWIILTGRYAYKIKRAVAFDFLDMTTLARRRFLCEEELRLNRRLAPDLYIDVVAITRGERGLAIGGSAQIVEYAVRMRQFDRSQELSALLDRGDVSAAQIDAFALRLARFHAAAAPSADCIDFTNTEHMRGAVLGNAAVLLAHVDSDLDIPELRPLIDWTRDYLDGSMRWFRQREQDGCIRECHGDLHARNIVRWRGELVAFDCLEFDPKLRWIDVMNDVAFLFMDLAARGRMDLAFVFLNSHVASTGDYDGIRLLPFYAVHRALVRAMVDALAAEQDPRKRRDFSRRFRARIGIAADFVRPKPPILILMHGPSGSGKSWLSERLAPVVGAVRIRSDVERKRLAGLGAGDPHTPQFDARTYARLRECATACLQAGLPTIVDAAFLRRDDRDSFKALAARLAVPCVVLSCEAERSILSERIAARARAAVDPSDADLAVLDGQLRALEPFGADERPLIAAVATSDPRALAVAQEAVGARRGSRPPAPLRPCSELY